jgi:oligoendopeptidase F
MRGADIFSDANLNCLSRTKSNAEYNRILGSQTVLWEGEERTPSQMYPLLFEKERATREKAWRAWTDERLKNRDAINDLWQKFMAVRLKIAENAGLPDYRSYMWAQRFRFDYSPEDCKSFHNAIEAVVVPAVKRIYEKRRRKLGIESVRPWDQLVTHPLKVR